MSGLVLSIAALLFVASATTSLFALLRPAGTPSMDRWDASAAQLLLLAAFATEAVALGLGCAQHAGRELMSVSGGIALFGWLGAAACLVVQRLWRMPQVGAFVTPMLALAAVHAALGLPVREEVKLEHLRDPALQVHVISATLAVALFALAAAIAGIYLVQQRQLASKRFGRLFSRLPSLQPLARLNARLVWAGLVAYGLAFVSGSMAASTLWRDGASWDAQQGVSLAVLALYGALALAFGRAASPRRGAVATVAAFLVAVAALGCVRTLPKATRHVGDYGLASLALEQSPSAVRR
ncbi:MAG: cytochrome c biogenesis protein CcsA [Myxococcales bacterium]